MKKHFNFLKNTILLLGGGLALLAGLASCENFLKGADVRKDLEDAIEIANSSPISYFVVIDEGSGTVKPDYVSVKKKEYFDLRFKPNSDWQFICWEVIDTATGQVVENYIKFEDPDQSETKAYVINPKEGLQIHARCVQIPTIIDVSPKGTSYANEPIVVKFNMPVEAEEITSEDSLFKLANINLSCKGRTVNELFEEPFFNSDKTELKIIPKTVLPQKNSDEPVLLSGYIKTLNTSSASVDVTFNDSIVVVKDNQTLGISNPQFSVYYSSETDQTPPTQYSFFVTRDSSITLENAESFTGNKFTQQDIIIKPEGMSDSDYADMVYENGCGNTVYIYGRFSDDGSGVKSVVVKELVTNDSVGDPICSFSDYNVKTITTEYTALSSPDIAVFKTINNETRFLIKHVFKPHIQMDSYHSRVIMTLNISINDYCYNSVKMDEFKLVKTNFFWLENDFGYGGCTKQPLDITNWVDYDLYMESLMESIKSEYYLFDCKYFNFFWIDFYGHPQTKISFKDGSLDVSFQYADKDGQLITKPAIPHEGPATDEDGNEYDYTLTFDMQDFAIYPGSSIKSIVTCKELGCSEEYVLSTFADDKQKIFPNIYVGNDDKKHVRFYYEDGSEVYSAFLTRQNAQSTKQVTKTLIVEPGCTYGVMIGPVEIKDFSFTVDAESNTIDEVGYKSIDITKSPQKGMLIYTVNLNDNVWSYYDNISFKYFLDPRDKYYTVPKGQTSFSFELGEYKIFDDWTLNQILTESGIGTLYGYKNNLRTNGKECVIQTITRDTATDEQKMNYDNTAPIFIYNMKGTKVELKMIDTFSGIKQGKIELKDRVLTFDTDPNTTSYELSYTIPMNEIVSYTYDSYSIHFNGEDNAGNKLEEQYTANTYIPSYYGKVINYDDDPSIVVIEFKMVPDNKCNYFKFDENLDDDGKIKGFPTDFDTSNIIYAWKMDTGSGIVQRRYIQKSLLTEADTYYMLVFEREYPNYKYSYNTRYVCMQYYGPMYCYSGTPGTGENDFMIPNGNSKESIVINSDKPVFVHTVATSEPLAECSDWDYTEWEYYKENHGERILQFSENSSPKVYNVPVNEIDSGKCYVVIAHYSNNNVIMSDVMVR